MQPMVPEGVWKLPESSRFLLWAELDSGSLNVLENLGEKGFFLRKRIPISIGKLGIGKQSEGRQANAGRNLSGYQFFGRQQP